MSIFAATNEYFLAIQWLLKKLAIVLANTCGKQRSKSLLQPFLRIWIVIVSVLHQNKGGIGKFIPSALKISLGSQEISWGMGMDFLILPLF